jgi:tetratricopeptide (TPR) repeat protein
VSAAAADPNVSLESFEQEFRAAVAGPPENFSGFLQGWLPRLRALRDVDSSATYINLLTEAAFQVYLTGDDVYSGVETAALAVILAERHGDLNLRRRALSLQGLVLNTARNTSAALDCTQRSLDLAQRLNHSLGIAVGWSNLGLCFLDASLFQEAERCYQQSVVLATDIPDPEHRASILSRALYGVSLCRSTLQDHAGALGFVERAIPALGEPSNHEFEQIRALIEAHRARLLLRIGRIEEARTAASAATDFAERSGARRAVLGARQVTALLEVYRGNHEQGLQELVACQQLSGHLKGTHDDALRDLTVAYGVAGRPDAALRTYRELIRSTERARMQAMRQQFEAGHSAGVAPVEERRNAELAPLAARVARRLAETSRRSSPATPARAARLFCPPLRPTNPS